MLMHAVTNVLVLGPWVILEMSYNPQLRSDINITTKAVGCALGFVASFRHCFM